MWGRRSKHGEGGKHLQHILVLLCIRPNCNTSRTSPTHTTCQTHTDIYTHTPQTHTHTTHTHARTRTPQVALPARAGAPGAPHHAPGWGVGAGAAGVHAVAQVWGWGAVRWESRRVGVLWECHRSITGISQEGHDQTSEGWGCGGGTGEVVRCSQGERW